MKNRDGVSCQLVILIFSSFHHHQFITNSKMIKCVHNQVKINHIDIPMGDIEKNESTYADSSIGEGMDITIQVVMLMLMLMLMLMIGEGIIGHHHSVPIHPTQICSDLWQQAKLLCLSNFSDFSNFSGCKWPFEKG